MKKLFSLLCLLAMFGCSSEKHYYAIIHVRPGHPEYFQSQIRRLEISAENDSIACAEALSSFYISLDMLYKDYQELVKYNDDIVFDPYYLDIDVYDEDNKFIPIRPQYKESGLIYISDDLQREIDSKFELHKFSWSWEKTCK